MASTTTNIGLTKPAGTDQALISAINGNMDIIDTKMGAVGNTSVQSQITSLSDQIATIGGSNKSWISNAELNDFKTTGHYYIGSGAKVGGTAVTAYNWSVLVVDGGRTDTLAQTLFTNGNKLERQFRDNAWTSFVSISDQIGDFVRYKSITATTTSSGAVAIPSSIGANRVLSAHYTDGKTGLIFKRDQSYFTCLDNNLSPYNTVSVTFNVIFLSSAPPVET